MQTTARRQYWVLCLTQASPPQRSKRLHLKQQTSALMALLPTQALVSVLSLWLLRLTLLPIGAARLPSGSGFPDPLQLL